MNTFEIFAIAMLFVLIACVYAYAHITNNIIRDQEKEIARQQTEIFRLQAKLAGRQRVRRIESGTQTIEIHDDRIDPENVPNFDKEW